MSARANLATAVGGSALGHLLMLGGAVGWIAIGGVPDNDDFSLRTKLGAGKDVEATGSNFAASREGGEPLHADVPDQSGSVWWSWQAPADAAEVLIEVELQGGEPVIGVYRGFAVDKLELVEKSKNGTLSFAPSAEEHYHLAVAGALPDEEGVINLRIRAFTEEESEIPVPEEEETALLLPEVIVEEKEEDKPNPLNYVRTTQNDRAPVAPDSPSFESDRNTIAASELPAEADGLENMPSQDGVDLPFLEMADRDDVDGELGDDATIPIASMEIIEPLIAPQEQPALVEFSDQPALEEIAEVTPPTPELMAAAAETLIEDHPLEEAGEFAAEQLAATETEGENQPPVEQPEVEQPEEEVEPEDKEEQEVAENRPPQPEKLQPESPAAVPTPPPSPGSEEAKKENVFQPHTRRNRVAGTISNRGKSAVNAAETPLGRYTRKVTGAVERRWHMERRVKADFVTYGSLRVSFVVGKTGKAGRLKIIENDANPIMTDFTLGAILDADIPPMPSEVRELLGDEPLEITYDVIIY